MKNFYYFIFLIVMVGVGKLNAQTPVCLGSEYTFSAIAASTNCFPDNPPAVPVEEEYLIVSNPDTIILGATTTNTFDPDLLGPGLVNVVPISYDLIIIQNFVMALQTNPTCCAVINQVEEDFPGICDSVLIVFPGSELPQNATDVLQIIDLFTDALTLRSFQLVVDGINEQAGLLGAICPGAGTIEYCLDVELDFGVNAYNIVETELVTFDTADPLCGNATYDMDSVANPSISGGTWGGDAAASGSFDAAAFGAGPFTATYDYTDANGCEGSDTFSGMVIAVATPDFDAVAVCPTGIINLSTMANPTIGGGTWGGGADPNGDFDTAASGSGLQTVSYSYTDGNGCDGTVDYSFTVFEPELATFDAVELCPEGIPDLDDAANPSISGGTWGGDADELGHVEAALLGPGFYLATYSYTDGSGCQNSVDLDVTILEPETVSFDAVAVCPEGIPDLDDVANPSIPGGTWGGDADEFGHVEAEILGAGSYSATYDYTDANGCAGSATVDITIYSVESVTFDVVEVCPDGTVNLNLEANPSITGGTWGGAAAANGNLAAGALGTGDYNVTYDYTDGNGCAGSTSLTVTVTGLETLLYDAIALCFEQGVVDLDDIANPSIPDGVWGGDTDAIGTFDAAIGIGTYSVTYSYIDGFGCPGVETMSVSVAEGAPLTFQTVSVCGSGVFDLNVEAAPSVSGGTWGGIASTNGTFDAGSLAPGSHDAFYDYSDANGCAGTATIPVTILAPMAFSADAVAVCPEAGMVDLNVASAPSIAGGSWGGAAAANGTFDATAAGPGAYVATYTYTDGNGCEGNANIDITVYQVQALTLLTTQICYGEVIDLNLVVGPDFDGGTWGGNAAADGSFDAGSLGAGNHDVTYDYFDFNGCAGSETITLTVMPIMPAAVGPFEICSYGDENLNNELPANMLGGLWGGVADYFGDFYTGVGAGDYTAGYYYIDNNVCMGSGNVNVTVLTVDPRLDLGPVQFCVSDGVVDLNDNVTPGIADGEWGDAASVDGIINAALLGAGNYTADYYVHNDTVCAGTDSLEVTLLATASADFTPVELSETSGVVNLNAAAAPAFAGTWSACASNVGEIDPAVEGPGIFAAAFAYTDSNGCTAEDTLYVSVLNAAGEIPDSTIVVCESPLSISFISFSGEHKDQTNFLNWTVSADIGINAFVVERSVDGNSFETIGKIDQPELNAGTTSFSFVDADLNRPEYYYRIMGVDIADDIFYSKYIVVKSGKNAPAFENLQIFPNPVSGDLNISFNLDQAALINFSVVNAIGQQVVAFTNNAQIGDNFVTRDFDQLNNGMYFLIINLNDRQVIRKIIKQ